MIKDETRKALKYLLGAIEVWRMWAPNSDYETQAMYKVAAEAEKFARAFKRNELKIDD